jgi:adenosylcobinamide-GDP ribazoletransferase
VSWNISSAPSASSRACRCPPGSAIRAEALNRSARYFPAVGLLVGGIGALVYLGAAQLWPQAVAVLLSMAATIYATGAFHEDGLSDTVDGLGGGWEKLRILEIMKDSRVGSYGVVAMVLALLGKFLLLSSLDRR